MYVLEDDQEDQIETIHVYMLREDNQQPEPEPPRWPGLQRSAFKWDTIQQWIIGSIAMFMLVGFTFAPAGPAFVIKTLRIPLIPLPIQTFTASANIVPTGVQQYPAVQAIGNLTVYNGSILQESLPAGFIVTSASGVEIATDAPVTIPAANPPAFGVTTTRAHAVVAGAAGNIAAGAIHQADGSSLVIKNLAAFTGGADAYTVKYATTQDVNNATTAARAQDLYRML